jgi:hypothetical protein
VGWRGGRLAAEVPARHPFYWSRPFDLRHHPKPSQQPSTKPTPHQPPLDLSIPPSVTLPQLVGMAPAIHQKRGATAWDRMGHTRGEQPEERVEKGNGKRAERLETRARLEQQINDQSSHRLNSTHLNQSRLSPFITRQDRRSVGPRLGRHCCRSPI